MKTLSYKLIYLLLLGPLLLSASNNVTENGRYNKQKSLSKEFKVTPDALMKINNNYGNLDITSWDENRIVMDIVIKVSGNDEEVVVEKLKNIDVRFESTPTLVSAKTIFDHENKSWWSKLTDGWNTNNLKMEINYRIKIPISNNIDLSNDYGSITLDKIRGNAIIECDYGQVQLGELLGSDNRIEIDYTHNSSIVYMKNGRIEADYSDFVLEEGGTIKLDADYSKSVLQKVRELSYDCDYGSLKIGLVDHLQGSSDYLGIKIGTIETSFEGDSDYGSIAIERLKSSVNNVIISTSYSGVHIGYDPEISFSFELKSSYGGIKLDGNHILEQSEKKTTSKFYKGYYGKKNSTASINITTSYGDIRLNSN